MSQTGKLTPNLDQHSTKALNLIVLQRIDPFIEEILITAAHVTFYEFNIESNQWVGVSFLSLDSYDLLPSLRLNSLYVYESLFSIPFLSNFVWFQSRKDVEGSLFVVKRNTQPRFQFIVMNRRNTDNLVENLLGDFEYEVQVPYLLYRNAAQEVNGIWFYNPRECEEVANLFTRILSAYSKVPSKPKVSSSKSEFEELEAVPSMLVMEGPLEPQSSTVSTAADAPEDPSFVNFFSAAMNLGGGALNATNTRPNYHSSSNVVPQPSYAPSVVSTPAPPTPQAPTLPLSASSTPIPLHGTSDPNNNNSILATNTNLVKPSSFFPQPSPSSSLMMPPISSPMPNFAALHAPPNLQRTYGTPLLQPFPPPNPPPSLTPSPSLPVATDGLFITRDKVRDALLVLVQDDQFIDMFHRALLKVHQS
ncbi:hypothetical protein G4B88_010325 [Cannabis sativa]|uniref:mRNA-decapping enzyme-like protein n=1 Tax=Cannabis sativa TaxID=3483 RepID=A0A7J6I5S5_CANSA|nr:hypothetical protein G4B88_010325 [Cannabis sativa]